MHLFKSFLQIRPFCARLIEADWCILNTNLCNFEAIENPVAKLIDDFAIKRI